MKRILLGILIITSANTAYAMSWEDLWWRKDEQGKKLMAENKFAEAAKRFEDRNWRGVAHYRSGHYYKAVKDFANDQSAQGHYNRGTALAHMGYYQDAINAYQQALKLQENHTDAKHNLNVVKKLLKRKQQQQPNLQAKQKHGGGKQNTTKQNNQNDKNKSRADSQEQQSNQVNSSQKKQNQRQQQNQAEKNQKEQSGQQLASKQHRPNEKDQSHKQWLRRIPDDPGGLLKNKFYRDYLNRRRQNTE